MDVEPSAARGPAGNGASPVTMGIAAIALLLYALWGGNPVAAKLALVTLPPIGLAGLRFGLAAALLAAWCAYRREPLRPSRGEVTPLALNGVLFTVQIATFYLGTAWSTGSHSSVLVNAFPIFVAVFAHFWLVGDRLSAGKAVGIGMGFAGLVAVFLDRWGQGPAAMIRGDVVLLSSALILGFQNIYFKDSLARISPYKMTFWQMVICCVPGLGYSVAFEGLAGARPDAIALWALAYQGVLVGAISFTIWAVILRRVQVSKLTVFAFSTPLWGVVLSHLLLGEPLTARLAVGMAMVAAGIGIAARS